MAEKPCDECTAALYMGLAIDAAGIGILGYLLKRDLDAQDKRVARMTREEGLGGLQIELADKKSSRLAQLRQFVRIVNVAGTSQQMSDALEEAEEFRELLVELGFMIIPLPIFEESDAQKDKHNQLKDIDLRYVRHSLLVDSRECLFLLPISVAEDREASTHGIGTQSSTPGFCVWRIRLTSLQRLYWASLKPTGATALRQGAWESWFQTQMKTANKTPEKGLYISLSMDGRVRGSGTGSLPWDWLAVALPPVSGPGAWWFAEWF
ncbi:TPA: hypothetical protein ACH3X1_010010 [Trebouxia sp. C0004]